MEHLGLLQCVSKELPVVWSILNDICNLQNTAYLPQPVSRIVIKIVEIRKNTFVNFESRADANYIPYDGLEHPTMFFPNHRLQYYPKNTKSTRRQIKIFAKNHLLDTRILQVEFLPLVMDALTTQRSALSLCSIKNHLVICLEFSSAEILIMLTCKEY